MKHLSKITNLETKQVEIGYKEDEAFYIENGFSYQEVEQAYNGAWYLKGYAPEKPVEEKEAEVRAERDRRIDAVRWRIERYQTQRDAALETTETAEQYQALLIYVQALRDVPEQAGFPNIIEWPEIEVKEETENIEEPTESEQIEQTEET